jgi:hypothetical protein
MSCGARCGWLPCRRRAVGEKDHGAALAGRPVFLALEQVAEVAGAANNADEFYSADSFTVENQVTADDVISEIGSNILSRCS